VATAFALAVTHPQAGNLGGGGFMVIRTPEGEVSTIDYRERAPMAATPDMFLKPDGTVDEDKIRCGFLASGVPGTVAGLCLAHERFGRLPWRDLLEPACRLAEQGFEVDEDLARAFRKHRDRLARCPDTVRTYFRGDGTPPGVGDRLVQPNLAKTLYAIRMEKRDGFYRGATAKELVRAVREGGGILTERDLRNYVARERVPIRFKYRDVEVLAMGLPSSGGVVLRLMLYMLEGYDLKNMEEGKRAHLLVEVMRRAYCDRARYLGDGDFVKAPLARLGSRDYAEALAKGIDLFRATDSHSLDGDLTVHPAPDGGDSGDETEAQDRGTGQTTHFCTADGDGWVVSNTYTLEESFGGKAVAGETGVLMNNEMGDFNRRPGFTCEDGGIGTEPNLIEPGKRMLSSMCPVILLREGKPFAAFGSPGGRTIINTVLQVIVNLVDLDMSMEEAVRAPRLHHQWFPDRVKVEKSMSERILKALVERGHRLKETDFIGDCHALYFYRFGKALGNLADTRIRGVADRRIDGAAAGFTIF
jgi:gamma-glutamyltranspeptidase/glutathione hydrolase